MKLELVSLKFKSNLKAYYIKQKSSVWIDVFLPIIDFYKNAPLKDLRTSQGSLFKNANTVIRYFLFRKSLNFYVF